MVPPIPGRSTTTSIFCGVNSLDFARALKRTKAYSDLDDTRPTLRDKPSGLKTGWYRGVVKPFVSQKAPPSHGRSSSSSTLVSSADSRSPVSDSDHTSYLTAKTPQLSLHRMSAFREDLVPLLDMEVADNDECESPKGVSDYWILYYVDG